MGNPNTNRTRTWVGPTRMSTWPLVLEKKKIIIIIIWPLNRLVYAGSIKSKPKAPTTQIQQKESMKNTLFCSASFFPVGIAMEEIATVTETEAKNCLQKTPTKKVLGRKRSLQQDFLTLSLNSCHLIAATRDHQPEEECQMSSPSPPPIPIRRRNKRCRRLMFFATGSTTRPPSSTAPAPDPARPRVLFASEWNAL